MKERTIEQIDKLYGNLFENEEINKLSHWIEPNSAEEFTEKELLENAEALAEDFHVFVNNMFDDKDG